MVSFIFGEARLNKKVNYITLYKTINATAIYTVIAISRIDGETLSTNCEIKFLPYTLYINDNLSILINLTPKLNF